MNKNKDLLIVGGSGGIGGAAAAKAAAQGWRVFLGYNKGRAAAEKRAADINRAAGTDAAFAVPLPMGLTVLDEKKAKLGAVLFSASPAPRFVSFLKTEREEFADQFDVNVSAFHALLTAVWKNHFQPAGGGHVVAVSSKAVDGSAPQPHMAAYAFGKKAMEGVLESALAELGASGLRATVLRVGYTDTPMLASLHPHLLEAARQSTAGGKFLTPDEVAGELMTILDNPPQTSDLRVCRIG